MYDVIGHTEVRTRIAAQQTSYALQGPSGVGRRGIASEWIAERSWVPLKVTKSSVIEACRRPDLVYLIELDGPWTPLLRPLEEGRITAVILADQVPQPIRTRIPVFTVGYLSEQQVVQVLAKSFPRMHPRHLIARAANGTLRDVHVLNAAIQTLETLDRCLAEWKVPDFKAVGALPAYHCLRSLCLTSIGLADLPVSAAAKIRPRMARQLLTYPVPESENEARNLLLSFWGAGRG